MIVEAIIDLLLSPIYLLVDVLPSMEFALIPDSAFNTLKTILIMCSAVLPVSLCIMLLQIKIGIVSLNLAYALILRIKSFIPTMGH